jgi:hypothetical protein
VVLRGAESLYGWGWGRAGMDDCRGNEFASVPAAKDQTHHTRGREGREAHEIRERARRQGQDTLQTKGRGQDGRRRTPRTRGRVRRGEAKTVGDALLALEAG